MMRNIFDHLYEEIISVENLLYAWEEFIINKKKRADVCVFAQNLMDNILTLHKNLISCTYKHSSYEEFRISDPKPRIIHKARVCDRLLHHAVYRVLYPLFDQTFIFDSYSCRKNKGIHKAFKRLVKMARKESKNYTDICWALKCDIRKFFHSIDHEILIELLSERIKDSRLVDLLKEIIESFECTPGRGMPLGNLTSQLFANVYLDPLDKFVKHKLRAKYYLRYADDFLILGRNPSELLGYLVEINNFLKLNLKLSLHPDKIILRKLKWGIDFVGYIALPYFSLPRKSTIKRIFRILSQQISQGREEVIGASLQSYLGYLNHVDAYKLTEKLINIFVYCRFNELHKKGMRR